MAYVSCGFAANGSLGWFAMAAVAMAITSLSCTVAPRAAGDAPRSGEPGAMGRTLVVAQNHPNASDANPGTQDRPFKTISRAAELAQPGDTVLVHEGIYREWVAPARGGVEGKPITYQAAQTHKAIIRGSEVYSGQWEPTGTPDVWRTTMPAEMFGTFNPFAARISEARGGGVQGQVFIDGQLMREAKDVVRTERIAATRPTTTRSAGTEPSARQPTSARRRSTRRTIIEQHGTDILESTPGSWICQDGRTLDVHFPAGKRPGNCMVELSVRRRLFGPVRRAQNYIIVRGFVFEHCANDASFPQVGAVSCRSGQHWIVENNIIRFAKSLGLDCGAENEDPRTIPDTLPEDRYLIGGHHGHFEMTERLLAGRHLILNNVVSDCGQCGIGGVFSDGTVLMGNVIERNGSLIPGFESGGIKIHGLMNGTVEGNLVRDNDAWGIWLDCGYIGSRVTRNVVLNNKPSGIFLECCNGPGWIDNNIIAYNRGDGIYTHDASGATVAHNLIFGNTQFGVYMHIATNRLVPPYHYATGLMEDEPSACSWQRIFNNVIVDNADGDISLPLPAPLVQDNLSDYNLFGTAKRPMFVINANNGQRGGATAVLDAARRAFEVSGDPGLSQNELSLWRDRGALLTLPQWQAASGNDRHSLTGNISAALDLTRYELTLKLDGSAAKLGARPVQKLDVRDFLKFSRNIDKDFTARPLPTSGLLPGAFQSIGTDELRLTVWPVPYQRPQMPPKITVYPAPGSAAFNPVPPRAPRQETPMAPPRP